MNFQPLLIAIMGAELSDSLGLTVEMLVLRMLIMFVYASLLLSFNPVAAVDFAFFYIKDGVVRGVTKNQLIYPINENLEDLDNDLDPAQFFRANRQYLVQRSAIPSLSKLF